VFYYVFGPTKRPYCFKPLNLKNQKKVSRHIDIHKGVEYSQIPRNPKTPLRDTRVPKIGAALMSEGMPFV
jgi:hypothetical protein